MSSLLTMFFDGLTGFSRLFLLVGLVLAVVNTARFLARGRSVALHAVNAPPPADLTTLNSPVRGAVPGVWWPLVLIALGFVVGGRFRSTPWVVAVAILVAAAVGLGLRALRVAHGRRGDAEVAPAALAALLSAGALLLFGLLLTVRLVVIPDPATRVGDAFTAESGDAAARAVLLPALALALVVAAIAWAQRPRPERLGPPKRRAIRLRLPAFPLTEKGHLVGLLAVFALFAAPLLDDRLTIFGIATPEYGKVVYFVALAAMLGAYAHLYRVGAAARGGSPLEVIRARRHLWYPIGTFAAVGVASALKQDIGPMIPVFVGSVAVFAHLLGVQADRAPEVLGEVGRARARARRRVALRYSRPLWAPVGGFVLIGVAAMVVTPYISERGAVWVDPWTYNWAAACEPAPEGATPPPTPEGTSACQISYSSAEASRRSQIAQSLAVIADGGLWGRGLDDSTSGRVPAGSTDFVLTVIWSKLGGITILLLAGLLALLAAALSRIGPQVTRTEAGGVDPARLFVVGFRAMVLGQFLFVLAATVNALPHSGITAPFLSRGGHSTIALGLGVIAAVAVSYLGAPAPATPAAQPVPAAPPRRALAPAAAPARVSTWWARPTVPGAAWVYLLSATLVVGITLSPYTGLAEDRPFCTTQQPRVDPEQCSTDRIAYDRTTVRVLVDGKPQWVRDRSGARWEPLGTPDLSLADLGGLLQVGGDRGVLEAGLTDIVDGSSGTSLGQRLAPPSSGRPDGAVELTVDPAIQRATTGALLADGPTGGPLAGGAVVVDAKTGHVLAAASAPVEPGEEGTARPVDQTARREFTGDHGFGSRDGQGNLDESTDCVESDDERVLADCYRWSLAPTQAGETPQAQDRLRRFVEDDKAVAVPSPQVNRALGRQYGLGSTFKVVVAAAFIKTRGATAQTVIDAPLTVTVNNQVIRNAGNGACGQATSGRITLQMALAVSCNTAFVRLAQDLGWDVIRDTAKAMGFVVGSTDARADRQPAWLAGTPVGVDSRVPATADDGSIGNNVLGGGGVVGTPLEMATVLGAVANGGTAVQPTVVSAVTDPRDGVRREVTGTSTPVLTPEQAEQLRQALSATTTSGTARKLVLPQGQRAWVKTGTQVQYEPGTAPRGTFLHQIAWLVGFVDTASGPVSFAVAVETRDEGRGADRARFLAEKIIAAITAARG
ncbi:penicillin-binding transpeptidase domain-containing protein [Actinokineospora spheciospongiae]|uniref:penicillin-binding transpeptidase domain-containing protein n=1 Tax=Actinokineospora spheciospongiae TaxID=909613 RepID=UPI000D717207|nr:penicillin-binding transpeptidase domain-containing protein [Actinokineospora spheciospongiae]PWW59499.1 cell cycle protein [Actinokineospora spheciospongiae]